MSRTSNIRRASVFASVTLALMLSFNDANGENKKLATVNGELNNKAPTSYVANENTQNTLFQTEPLDSLRAIKVSERQIVRDTLQNHLRPDLISLKGYQETLENLIQDKADTTSYGASVRALVNQRVQLLKTIRPLQKESTKLKEYKKAIEENDRLKGEIESNTDSLNREQANVRNAYALLSSTFGEETINDEGFSEKLETAVDNLTKSNDAFEKLLEQIEADIKDIDEAIIVRDQTIEKIAGLHNMNATIIKLDKAYIDAFDKKDARGMDDISEDIDDEKKKFIKITDEIAEKIVWLRSNAAIETAGWLSEEVEDVKESHKKITSGEDAEYEFKGDDEPRP